MWKNTCLAGAALAVLVAGGPARAAAPVVYGPVSDVTVGVLAHQGPNVMGSTVQNTNGNQVSINIGPGGSASSSGSMAQVEADAYIPGNSGSNPLTATGHGAASLAAGTLKASVFTTGPDNFGSPGGDVTSRIADTVYFHNATAGALALGLIFTFEGDVSTLTPTSASSSGYAILSLSGCGNCGDLRFAADNMSLGDSIASYWNDLNGVYQINSGSGGIPLFGDLGHWHTEAFGDIGSLMATTVLIPTGDSALGLQALLNVSCRSGDQCDFGHTARFGFGALPTGLSYTSASGSFLSAVSGGPGGGVSGVPEPATWGLMIAGFGLVGAVQRSRRRAAA